MKRRFLLVIVGLSAVTASVAAYYRANQTGSGPQWLTAAVIRGDVVETVDATGTLEAVTTVQVGSQVSGTIKALHADFNSRVRKGQIVAELDPSLFETQVEQAEATLVRLQAEVDRAEVQVEDTRLKLARARQLAAQQLIPAIDLETAEANARAAEASRKAAEAQVVQARASLNQSRVNLNHTIIRAPIDGIVISRNVDVGQTVAASMSAPTLFVIANDLRRMQVSARIDESDIGRIEAGQPVGFRVDAYPDDIFTGTVTQVRLEPVVEQNVVSYVTVIDVPNPDLKLKPGMTASVTVEIARADDVVRVPAAALRFRPTAELLAAFPPSPEASARPGPPSPEASARQAEGRGARGGDGPIDGDAGPRARVWVLADGRLQPVAVRPGVSDGANTAIEGSLAEGAQVVTGLAAGQSTSATTTTGSPLLPRFPGNRGAAAGQRAQGAGGAR
ncbi:MAG: efflux RND transporter periplasmic adaptor subunit [Acidobacteria bacterium]|nr:efflux RND transporter periplasmic adaptor subunit [Acidobacteriota bacterium]